MKMTECKKKEKEKEKKERGKKVCPTTPVQDGQNKCKMKIEIEQVYVTVPNIKKTKTRRYGVLGHF